MVIGSAVFFSFGGGLAAQTLPTSEDCRSCHLTLGEERLSDPARVYDTDIHAETGFGCLACHGSGGFDRLDPRAGFLSKPARQEIPGMCGRCHSDGAFMRQFNPGLRTDQESEYWTSVHGQRLREENDQAVATCIDCHPAHEIRPPSDPESTVYPTHVIETCGRCHADEERMAPYGIPTDQVEEYRGSVHGQQLLEAGDVSAPVCNDCHGNHGAAPPGISSVRNVCGQCHSVMADFFDQSQHEEIFDAADLPGCVACHGNHGISMATDAALGTRSREVCTRCHTPGDPNGQAFRQIAGVLDSLAMAVEESRAVLEDAENKGMEVSQALFELEDVTNAEVRARSAIHTLNVDAVRNETKAGLDIAARAEERGEEALEEHHFRRVGLGVSAGIILLLITAVFLRMRDSEARSDDATAAVSAHFEKVMGSGGSPGPDAARVAGSALLLEAAYTDDALSEADRRFVDDVVRSSFGLSGGQADELIAVLRRQAADAGRVGTFSGLVSTRLSQDGLDTVLEEFWRLVFSDETLAEHEIQIMEDLAKLLHVHRDTVAAARRRATTGAAMGGGHTGMGEDR